LDIEISATYPFYIRSCDFRLSSVRDAIQDQEWEVDVGRAEVAVAVYQTDYQSIAIDRGT